MTKDLVPLEPKVSEYKLYARDVGPVLTVKTSGGSGSEELVSYSRADRASATATATPAATETAVGSASALAETGGAFPLTPLAPLALLAVLFGLGVLAFRVVRSD